MKLQEIIIVSGNEVTQVCKFIIENWVGKLHIECIKPKSKFNVWLQCWGQVFGIILMHTSSWRKT